METTTTTATTIILKIFSSFSTSQNCKDVYERLCITKMMENYGPDKQIYITNNNDEYTHVLILNTAMPIIRDAIPKKNIIGMAFEPHEFLGLTDMFIQYARDYISKYYIGSTTNLPEPFIGGKSYMWYITPLSFIPIKNKNISIMVSFKKNAPGHKYRHSLVKRILSSPLPIDIYGNGCNFYTDMKDDRIKGEFKGLEPYQEYMFHIAIENYQLPHYYSEKIMDPLLCNTTPIYWGCSHIDDYFPNMVIPLSGNITPDMELLYNIVLRPEDYKKKIHTENVKRAISLLDNIQTLYL